MSQSNLITVSEPAASLLSLAEVKTFLRIDQDITAEDTLLTQFISVATTKVQSLTGRALLTTGYSLQIDSFREIELPKPPFISVSSITYYDVDGAEQTLPTDNYEIHTADDPAIVEFKNSLPSLELDRSLPITINYTAGYGATATDVPDGILTYAMMLVGDLADGSRSTQTQYAIHMNPTAKSIIGPYIV